MDKDDDRKVRTTMTVKEPTLLPAALRRICKIGEFQSSSVPFQTPTGQKSNVRESLAERGRGGEGSQWSLGQRHGEARLLRPSVSIC